MVRVWAMAKSGATKFLVDGFPRNFDNLDGWFAVMGRGPAALAHVDGVLQFDVSEEVLVARLLKRGETSGRSDDNAEAIVKRLHTYNESTVAVVAHFEKQGKVTKLSKNEVLMLNIGSMCTGARVIAVRPKP